MTKNTLTTISVFTALLVSGAILRSGVGSANPAQTERVPVLLELFTSEGCSSCPPADKLLQSLDRDQPVEGADLIVLSEHVDYWNHDGWVDPYSSHLFSQRQEEYAARLGTSDIYTPQLVVDGVRQLVGSNRRAAQLAIEESLHAAKIPLTVTAQRVDGAIFVHLEAGSAQVDLPRENVYLVLAADQARSEVTRGENAGRALAHVAVAYSVEKISILAGTAVLKKDVQVASGRSFQGAGTRVILFVQDPSTNRILGVAQTRL